MASEHIVSDTPSLLEGIGSNLSQSLLALSSHVIYSKPVRLLQDVITRQDGVASCREPVWLLGVKYADWEEEEVGQDEGWETTTSDTTAVSTAICSATPSHLRLSDKLSSHVEASQAQPSQTESSEQAVPSSVAPAVQQTSAQATAHLNGCVGGEQKLHSFRKSHSEWEEVDRDDVQILQSEENTPASKRGGVGTRANNTETHSLALDAANDSATGGHWGSSSWMAARSALISGMEAIRQAQEQMQEHVQQQWQGTGMASGVGGGRRELSGGAGERGGGEGGEGTVEAWSRVHATTSPEDVNVQQQQQQQYQRQVHGPAADAAARLLDDFQSRLWMTYRTGFPPLDMCTEREGSLPTGRGPVDGRPEAPRPVVTRAAAGIGPAGAAAGLTSDVGWGCMFRTGQMMMAQALICHHLGRQWRLSHSTEEQRQLYLRVVRCFADEPSPSAPLSLHSLLTAGRPHGVAAGEWLGPFKLCLTLATLVRGLEAREREAGKIEEGGGSVGVETLEREAGKIVEPAEEMQGGEGPNAADRQSRDVGLGGMGWRDVEEAGDPKVDDCEAVVGGVDSRTTEGKRHGRGRETLADEILIGADLVERYGHAGDELVEGGSMSTPTEIRRQERGWEVVAGEILIGKDPAAKQGHAGDGLVGSPREESFVQVGRHDSEEWCSSEGASWRAGEEQGGRMLAGVKVHVVGVDPRDEVGGTPVLYVDDVAQLCRQPARDVQRTCPKPSSTGNADVDVVVEGVAGETAGKESGGAVAGLAADGGVGGGMGQQEGEERERWERLLDGEVGEWCSVVVLIPLVLGVDNINPRYLSALQSTFCFPHSLGIAGGRPHSSTYLVGVTASSVLYLDPHCAQAAVNFKAMTLSSIDASSYHCSVIRRMPFASIDPSLALGFYCQNKGEFINFCHRADELALACGTTPLFTISIRPPQVLSGNQQSLLEGNVVSTGVGLGSRSASVRSPQGSVDTMSLDGSISEVDGEEDWELV